MASVAVAGGKGMTEMQKKNRIQVSNTKKPLFFYVNLAKKYIQVHNEVELSALGMAITTVVTIAEILKNNGLATEKKVLTSTVGMKDENRGRLIQKAKIEIVLGKTEKFDSLMTTATAAPDAASKPDAPTASEPAAPVASESASTVAPKQDATAAPHTAATAAPETAATAGPKVAASAATDGAKANGKE